MRVLGRWAMLLAALPLMSCGDGPCGALTGCVRADRVAGACQCAEWQTLSVENVPVKFVVLYVVYGTLGNASWAWYGHKDSPPSVSSELGARWRSTVRHSDGTERVADVGRLDDAGGSFFLNQFSETAVDTSIGGAQGWGNAGDVPSRAADSIVVWVNPVAIVSTDYVGQRKIDWSWSGSCFFLPFACTGAMAMHLTVAELEGAVVSGDPNHAAFLSTLSAAERTAILQHDAFLDPVGRDPASIRSDPRFEYKGVASLGVSSSVPDLSWSPCANAQTDFPVYREVELPFAVSSDVLVLQYSAVLGAPGCAVQQPSLTISTTTPGCEASAEVYVDRMFGTLLTLPLGVAPSCL
jgi:hypothetical protein